MAHKKAGGSSKNGRDSNPNFLGVKRFLRDAGLLTEKQAERVTQQELFEKLSNFTVPRMRVPGSGATSDFEANLFRTATATLGDDENTNRRIIASRLDALNLQQENADFYVDAVNKYIRNALGSRTFND